MKKYRRSFLLLVLVALIPQAHAALNRDAVKITANLWESKAAGGFGDFTPEMAYDGDATPASSWRAEPHEGELPWLQFSFPEPVSLRGVDIYFLSGDQRKYTIDILVSTEAEPENWQKLVDYQSSNPAYGPNTIFQFAEKSVKHVRIVGHGNSSGKFPHWTNITEVRFLEGDSQ